MDLRELKALELAARAKIVFHLGRWLVPSQTTGKPYPVTLDPPSCGCEDFQLRQQPCKHVIAARLVADRDGGESAPPMDTAEVPKRPTYRQNWPAYTLAQTTEKHRFRELLHDIARSVPQPPRKPGKGRTPVPIADTLFAMTFKVYSTVSGRRFMCDLKDAHEAGFLTRPVHFNSIAEYMENPAMTPVLKSLILRSSLPLATVETDFAVDSSGFTASRFEKWHDIKYGVERAGHTWVKCHLICGVRTNVVTGVEILGRDAADGPVLPSLVKATAEHFKIGEVSADKGYLSVENVETIHAHGGMPFIAPKVNTTGGVGGLFERMFHYYQFRKDDFLRHYHKRSNVESTFSMIKAKFRDHVRSRTETAMVNEVLCKVLAHNICVVHQSVIELGIEPAFWPAAAVAAPEDEGERTILRLPRRPA